MEKQSYSLIQAIFSSGIIVLVSGEVTWKEGKKIKLKKTCKQIVASSLHNGHTAHTQKGLAVISDGANSVHKGLFVHSWQTNRKTRWIPLKVKSFT